MNVRRNLQACEHILGKGTIEVGVEVREEIECAGNLDARRKVGSLRQIGHEGFRLRAGFAAGHEHLACRGSEQTRRQLDKRGFTAAIGPEQPYHAPARYGE